MLRVKLLGVPQFSLDEEPFAPLFTGRSAVFIMMPCSVCSPLGSVAPSAWCEHEILLVEWMLASWGLAQIEMLLQGVAVLVGLGGAGWIVLRYLAGGGEAGSVLLLLYWAFSLPALGRALVTSIPHYPMVRAHLLRLLEPLGAPEEDDK